MFIPHKKTIEIGSSNSSNVAFWETQRHLAQFEFARQIQREFVEGSGIAADLYRVATQIVGDTEALPGGEVAYPIHEALNWTLTRFGQQARLSLYAVLLRNQDGSTWQAKLSRPRTDAKGKPQKYETPVGNRSRAYFPEVPAAIRQLISHRYGVPVPATGSFWDWVEAHPEIPMVPTEGGKKGLALLSQGFVPLALYGVNGGYRKVPGDGRELIPDVARFAQPERPFLLAFDQDEREATRRRVNLALYRFGTLLSQAGCSVQIVSWNPNQGKGVDDLIVAGGAEAWLTAVANALPLTHWLIWQRLEQRLTYPTAVKVEVADLSTGPIADLPDSGIIGVASPKGTGKTKLIHQWVAETDKVLAGGHRIALMRNLSARLGLDYKGDLDKVNGEFINGSAYTLRIGLCVDSLLAIDPVKFSGCDLILDEVVQVLRHLLTSSTCARDGKRPALLARLRELMQRAKRVIVADADLDNATLHYLKTLRGEKEPVFLIRNGYQAAGYPVRFLEAPDRTVIVRSLLQEVKQQEAGQVVFVATDSKSTSKALTRLLAKETPDRRVLLVNSETSGGECEREFIQTPDAVLERDEYDVIICSPSVATGVSIEAQGKIARVYGIFTGNSSTDADMAQALGRVREAVERVVWCAQRGSNFSKVSRSTRLQDLKTQLQHQTTTTVRLLRSSLREDVTPTVESYDWSSDPHLNLYCRITADQNFSMHHLRQALLVRLKFEGNGVTVEDWSSDAHLKVLLATARQEQQAVDAATLVRAADLTYSEILALEQKETMSPEESAAIAKFYLKDFYALEELTVEDVLWDQEGRRRRELLNLEAQLVPELAQERTAKGLEKQLSWQKGYCPWDVSGATLRQRVRSEVGLTELLQKLRSGWSWTKYDLAEYATKARRLAPLIKGLLHFTVNHQMSDTQVVHQLLSQLGIKLTQTWSRSVPGYEGEKLRLYRLELEHWQRVWAVLERRRQKRERLAQKEAFGSPSRVELEDWGGDPGRDLPAGVAALEAAIFRGREAVETLLVSWDVGVRAEIIRQLWEQSEERMQELLAVVPNVFGWCAGAV